MQLAGCGEDLAQNAQAARCALTAAAQAGARLAVLPELATVPYFCGEPAGSRSDWSVAPDGPLIREVAGWCRTVSIAVVFPFYERGAAGACHNSALLIDADGRRVTGYGLLGPVPVVRKLHLPRSAHADELRHFRPGDDLAVFELAGLNLGCLICYDRRFPECWRALRHLGADAVAVPIAGLSGEDDAFVLGELRTHARENGLAVISAARTGSDRLGTAEVAHPGGSCVIAADGTVLARCGSDPEPDSALAEIAPADILRARQDLPLFEQRHPLLRRGLQQGACPA